MKKLLHLLLLYLMIAAIPVQGVAAATMLYCGTGHHHTAAEDQHEQHEQHGQHEQHNHDAYQHHANDASSLHSPHSPHSHHSHSYATTHKLVKDKCSSCAACCVGAALMTTSIKPAMTSPSSEKIVQIFSPPISHISNGLERPPRA